MAVRPATPDDLPAVATVLDAAMLATDDLRERVAADDVLVALEDGRVLGALVVAPRRSAPRWARERGTDAHVVAVAVRRRRRGQGVGSALVAAVERGRLTAAFDRELRPFYAGLGFDVTPGPDGRLRGVRPVER
jgi:GNAT superfamily N-acetyltransferase